MDLPPPLPPEVLEDGAPLLAEMLTKLLAKKPEERFQTATELMAMLDAVAGTLATKGVLHDLGLQGRDSSGAGRMLRRMLRHLPRSSVARITGRRVAIALGLLFASMIAALVLAFRSASDPSPPGLSRVSSTSPGAPSAPRVAPAPGAASATSSPSRAAPKSPGSRKTGF
jgi:hypothetical protein